MFDLLSGMKVWYLFFISLSQRDLRDTWSWQFYSYSSTSLITVDTGTKQFLDLLIATPHLKQLCLILPPWGCVLLSLDSLQKSFEESLFPGTPTLQQHLPHASMTMVAGSWQFLSLVHMYAYGTTHLKVTLCHPTFLWRWVMMPSGRDQSVVSVFLLWHVPVIECRTLVLCSCF